MLVDLIITCLCWSVSVPSCDATGELVFIHDPEATVVRSQTMRIKPADFQI